MKKSVSWGNYPKYNVKIEQIDSNKFSFKKNLSHTEMEDLMVIVQSIA